MHRLPAALALAVLLALSLPGTAAGRARWQRPVGGAVVRAYDFTAARRFARGQHRGVTFAAGAGQAVRAPCGGPVLWAGAVGSVGRGVTVACGRLNATLTRLGAVGVRRGVMVAPGQVVGRAGAAGVQLGARERDDVVGYRDPMGLIGDPGPAVPPVAAPRPGRIRRPAAPRPEPVRIRVPVRVPVFAPAREPARAPAPAVPIGLGLLGAGLSIGVLRAWGAALRRRLVRRSGPEPGAAVRGAGREQGAPLGRARRPGAV